MKVLWKATWEYISNIQYIFMVILKFFPMYLACADIFESVYIIAYNSKILATEMSILRRVVKYSSFIQ